MKNTFGLWVTSALIAAGAMSIGGDARARIYSGSSGRAYNPNGQACVTYEMVDNFAGQGIAVAAQCASAEVEIPILLPYGTFTLIQSTFTAFGNNTGDVSCNLVVIDGITGDFVSQTGYKSNPAPSFQTVTLDNTLTSANAVGYVDCILRNNAILETVTVNEVGGEPLRTWPGSSGHAVSGNTEQGCFTYSGAMITNSNCAEAHVVIPVPTENSAFVSTGRITVFSPAPDSALCRFVAYSPDGSIPNEPTTLAASALWGSFEDMDLGSALPVGGSFAYECFLNQNASVLATYTNR